MSDTAKKKSRLDPIKPPTAKGPRKKRWGLRLFYALVFLLIFCAIAICVVWVNRNLVMEEGLKRYLSARGYESAFIIDHVTDTDALIRNITLKHDGEVFFKADTLTAKYSWPQVRFGSVHSVNLESPYLKLSLDEDWAPKSAWLPKTSGEAGFIFPEGGIALSGARADIASPIGILPINADIDAASLTQVKIKAALSETLLRHEGASAQLSAQLSGAREGDLFTIDLAEIDLASGTIEKARLGAGKVSASGQLSYPSREPDGVIGYEGGAKLKLSTLASTELKAEGMELDFDGSIALNPRAGSSRTLNVTGAINSLINELTHSAAFMRQAQLAYNGNLQIAKDAPNPLTVLGALSFDAQQAGLSDGQQAARIADKLTINDTLSSTPVAQHFNDGFTRQIERALAGVALKFKADIEKGALGHSLNLTQPLIARAKEGEQIKLDQAGGAPLIIYDVHTSELDLAANVDLAGARDLSLSGLHISGLTDNGVLWSDIHTVAARISATSPWQNGNIRLAPFAADLAYKAPIKHGDLPDIKLTSNLDYDGPLFGSDFVGLEANGAMHVRGAGRALSVSFDSDSEVTMDSVKTSLGWEARGVSLALRSGAPLYQRSVAGGQERSEITLIADNLRAHMYEMGGARDLAIQAGSANISGIMDEAAASSEVWDISLNAAQINSDTTPVKDTLIKTPNVHILLSRKSESVEGAGGWRYGVETPSVDANITPLRLRGSAVSLSGADGDFIAEYSGGTARLDGVDLPDLPMTGRAIYADGAVTGTAQTAMPRASKYPIYASYFYEDEAGGASLNIPDFMFTPNGVQPQDLAPVLRGKVADISGRASANVELGFKTGEKLTSRGSVTLIDMDIGTLVGPFSGVNTTLNFDSLVPLISAGRQNISMTGFNPGVELGAGDISFDAIEGGIEIHSAIWPLGQGRIEIDPTIWRTSGEVNRVSVRVSDVSLSAFLEKFGNENMQVTGQVSGVLPIVVDGVSVLVENGSLAIKDGGTIRVRTDGLDAAAERNETAKIAIDALKEFEYEELTLDINGPLDGNIIVGAVFRGRNKDVLGGAEFLFRVNLEGELVNIARSFANSASVEDFLSMVETAPN